MPDARRFIWPVVIEDVITFGTRRGYALCSPHGTSPYRTWKLAPTTRRIRALARSWRHSASSSRLGSKLRADIPAPATRVRGHGRGCDEPICCAILEAARQHFSLCRRARMCGVSQMRQRKTTSTSTASRLRCRDGRRREGRYDQAARPPSGQVGSLGWRLGLGGAGTRCGEGPTGSATSLIAPLATAPPTSGWPPATVKLLGHRSEKRHDSSVAPAKQASDSPFLLQIPLSRLLETAWSAPLSLLAAG